MITIDLSSYGPIIGNETVAKKIYDQIADALQKDEVIIDMQGIKLMATFCSKQIFGCLYTSLGGEVFYEKVHVLNATDNVKKTIGVGIEMTLSDTD